MVHPSDPAPEEPVTHKIGVLLKKLDSRRVLHPAPSGLGALRNTSQTAIVVVGHFENPFAPRDGIMCGRLAMRLPILLQLCDGGVDGGDGVRVDVDRLTNQA